jgi:hypothetical protein
MMTGGTPILGNLHMMIYTNKQVYPPVIKGGKWMQLEIHYTVTGGFKRNFIQA